MTVGRPLRRLLGALALVLALTALAPAGAALFAGPAGAATSTGAATTQQSSVSKQEAITQLGNVRTSIDETLQQLKASDSQESRDAAFAQARSGYLDHFELSRDPAARRRPGAHGQGRGPVRRDP